MGLVLRRLRALLCAMFDHPRGPIYTAGQLFCPSCVRDWYGDAARAKEQEP